LESAGRTVESLEDGTLELRQTEAVNAPDEINVLLMNSGHVPTQVLVEEEELEHYFLRLVGMDGGTKNA